MELIIGVQVISVSSIPEPESYATFLAGRGLLGLLQGESVPGRNASPGCSRSAIPGLPDMDAPRRVGYIATSFAETD